MQYRGHNRIRKLTDGRLYVNLTDTQQEPLGIVVGHIYYNNDALNSMLGHYNWSTANGQIGATRLESIGYPHNGGEHTMEVFGPKAEILAFLELAGEYYSALGDKNPRFKEGSHILLHLAAQFSLM